MWRRPGRKIAFLIEIEDSINIEDYLNIDEANCGLYRIEKNAKRNIEDLCFANGIKL